MVKLGKSFDRCDRAKMIKARNKHIPVREVRCMSRFDLAARLIIVLSFIFVPTGRPMLNLWNRAYLFSLEELIPHTVIISCLAVSILVYRLICKIQKARIYRVCLLRMVASVFIMSVPFLFIRMPVELVHLVIFSCLGISSRLSLENIEPGKATTQASLVIVITGFADEIAQYFWPGRFFDPYDILINCLAGVCGVISSALWCRGR